MSFDDEDHDPDFYRFNRFSRFDGRRTQSSKLPKVIKDLEGDDPSLDLDHPESSAHKNFHGNRSAPCILFTGAPNDAKWLPAYADASRPGVHLSFKISGAAFAKQLTISAKVASSNVSRLRQSGLKFFAGEHGRVENLSYIRRTPEEAVQSFGRAIATYVISWTTSGGYPAGLGPAIDYDEESITTFEALEALSTGVLVENTRIHLLVADVPGLAEDLQTISSATYKTPWLPYLNAAGKPQCSWRAFPKRADVKRLCGGLVPVPAQNSFATVIEAHVILANGICLEYRKSPKHDPGGSWPDTEQDQTYLKKQLLALENLWAGESAKRWWPALLNQATASLSVYNPLKSMQLSQDTIQQTWTTVEEAFPWDEHQRHALRASCELRGHIGVIEGGPGSGKSAVLAGIAVSYACSGCPVLLFAPMIAQARALAQAVTRLIGYIESTSKNRATFAQLNIIKLFRGEGIYERLAFDPDEYEGEFKSADIIIALPYAICSEELSDFASEAEKFLILHDDAHQLTESEVWGTVLSLSQRGKCKGLIMSTDVKEWPLGIATLSPLEKRCVLSGEGHRHHQMELPWMYSTWYKCILDKRKPPGAFRTKGQCQVEWTGGTNEFAEQTGMTFVSRLLRQGFPSVMLKGQHRLKEQLAKHMNLLVYKANPLAYAPVTKRSLDIDRFHTVLRTWLGPQALSKDLSVIFLEASYGKDQCIKERGTTESKRNHRNVDVVYDILLRNHRAKAVNADDIKIVTQYKDQVRLYELEFNNRAKESKIAKSSLPKPMTLDTLRGRQAKVIIYDLVVTCGDDKHGLGIVNNEFRASTAVTRACDTLIIVGSRELITLFPQFWNWMNWRTRTNSPLPMIVRYANILKDAGLSFEPPTPERKACHFPLKEEWHSTREGYFDWEWDKNNKAGERE